MTYSYEVLEYGEIGAGNHGALYIVDGNRKFPPAHNLVFLYMTITPYVASGDAIVLIDHVFSSDLGPNPLVPFMWFQTYFSELNAATTFESNSVERSISMGSMPGGL